MPNASDSPLFFLEYELSHGGHIQAQDTQKNITVDKALAAVGDASGCAVGKFGLPHHHVRLEFVDARHVDVFFGGVYDYSLELSFNSNHWKDDFFESLGEWHAFGLILFQESKSCKSKAIKN